MSEVYIKYIDKDGKPAVLVAESYEEGNKKVEELMKEEEKEDE